MTRTGIHKAVTVVLAVAVVALVVVLVGRGEYVPRPQGRGEAPWPSPAVSAPAVAPVAVEAGGLPGDGELLVPEQVAPGTYLSAGPSGRLPSCYVVLRDVDGQALKMPRVSKGQTVVVIPAEATLVETTGCQPFTKVR